VRRPNYSDSTVVNAVFLLSSPTSFRTRLTVLMLTLCKQNHTLFVPNVKRTIRYLLN